MRTKRYLPLLLLAGAGLAAEPFPAAWPYQPQASYYPQANYYYPQAAPYYYPQAAYPPQAAPYYYPQAAYSAQAAPYYYPNPPAPPVRLAAPSQPAWNVSTLPVRASAPPPMAGAVAAPAADHAPLDLTPLAEEPAPACEAPEPAAPCEAPPPCLGWGPRDCLQSDHCFDRFVGPISNPFLTKDPRSLTELRFLFIQDWIPGRNVVDGGDFQIYTLQARVALTERLTVFVDRDGAATLRPHLVVPSGTGWIDTAAGFKYTFFRDVEHQFLLTAGAMYQGPTGEARVNEGRGDGLVTVFLCGGKEIGCKWHLLGNVGYQVPTDPNFNSTFVYSQLHLDKQVFCWLYPLVEVNWFHWTKAGGQPLPAGLGEGDGLFNLGTPDVAGNDLVTVALGLKARCGPHLEFGAAYERPVSFPRNLIDNRVLAELILRY
jgi:hypothetical protein